MSGHAGAAPAAEDQVLLSVEYGDIGQALAHWCFADLLAVLCQLSTQVPALRQVI